MESAFIGRSTDEALKVLALLKTLRQRLIDELKPTGADRAQSAAASRDQP